MAAVDVAVVSGILKIVGNKLAPLVIKKYSSIVGVKKDLQELKDLVEEINYWLETIGDKAMGSGPSLNWLKQLKDVSYDVDDVVDEFQLKTEKHDACGDDSIVSKYLCTKPKSLIFQCSAAKKIEAIKRRFAVIVKQRTDFSAIANSLPVGHPVRDMNETTGNMSSLPIVDVTSVLGRDQEKNKIISKLVETNDQQIIKIVSVIGLGGSGKTTLAKLVFNDGNIIEKYFQVRLWVHVSQEFDVEKLIKKLFEAIGEKDPGQHPLPYMSNEISKKLTEKRFLVVLDDVWTENRIQWEDFMVHLKSGTPGSKILLTTRSREVAIILGSTDNFDLPFLSPGDSWQLFQQSLVMPMKDWDFEFEKIGKEIVKKCGGVPLAIKVLAGALHGKERIEEWQAMRDNNLLDVMDEERRVFACLRLSYLHLPPQLKQCLTICSLFPKGHVIDKEQLIDQWIAHDMITPVTGVDYLEYTGHKYFNSLVQVFFLQDVNEYDWRVKCRMHDLVHDLAQSTTDIFVAKEEASSPKSYRYVSLTEQPSNLPPKNLFKKVRAIYFNNGDAIISGNSWKNARHLRSITMKYFYKAEVPTAIFEVKYLKYLEILGLRCEALPEAISDIWSLQALHVTFSGILELPKSIGKLQRLRVLNLSWCYKLKCLPDSIGDCQMISIIDLFNCDELTVLPNSIGRNKELRLLRLGRTKIERLPSSTTALRNLECLDLQKCRELVELPEGIGNLENLQVLNLGGCENLRGMLVGIGQLSRLQKLILGGTKIERLPSSITALRNLECLDLHECRELVELPEGIGNLEKLQVLNLKGCENLRGMPVGIGQLSRLHRLILDGTKIERLPSSITTLRNLECLDLHECRELVELPEGIGNLEKLQVLNLKGCKNLRGMPVGIGQLNRLQKLGLFVVGKGEKFAQISELANVAGISEELTFTCIAHMMDSDDAHKARLKQKTNIQRLELNWGRNDREEVNTEMEQTILDGLEPPSAIKELYIGGYAGGRYAQWILKQVGGVQWVPQFTCLTTMKLEDFPNLKHLEGLVELRCLKELYLSGMPALERLSGGPFLSLVKLDMWDLSNLGEVWMVTGRTFGDDDEGQLQIGTCLSDLKIYGCPKLMVKPYFPCSLEHLQLCQSNEQLMQSADQGQGSSSSSAFPPYISFSHLKKLDLRDMPASSSSSPVPPGRGWELLQHMTALESLTIRDGLTKLPESIRDGLTELPESMRSLTSLRSLSIEGCLNLCMLPEWLEELRSLREMFIVNCDSLSSLPQSVCHLTSLQKLRIFRCKALPQLPECLGELCSLHDFCLWSLPGLSCLPQSMCRLTSLQQLDIAHCPGITSLPEGIKGLTSLEELRIAHCPGITSLPESIKGLTSLKKLHIFQCPGIKSLPESIKGLTALQFLSIYGCPDLERRCERGKGEDWHLISHIRTVGID